MEKKGNELHLAVSAGVFANLGSLFGKLAGIVDGSSMVLKNQCRGQKQLIILFLIRGFEGELNFCRFAIQSLLLLKLVLLGLMVTSNTMGCSFFVKALNNSASSLPATVVSAATNYFCSAIVGYLVFNETTSLIWWCGTSLVLFGLITICISSPNESVTKSKLQ